MSGRRLVLGGFSQGAMLAMDVALHTERALAGLVLMSVTSSMRQILIGFVLLAAVWFDSVTIKSR